MLATGTLADEGSKPRVIIWRPVTEGRCSLFRIVISIAGLLGQVMSTLIHLST
jgi:hypothetical protein